MYAQVTSDVDIQKPHSFGELPWMMRDINAGALLGNNAVQSTAQLVAVERLPMRRIETILSPVAPSLFAPKISRLEVLKKQRFNPEGKADRVSSSLGALNQEQPIRLAPEEWRRIAEDPDIEDQFQ